MNATLLERVLQSPRLPSLPTIALEVIDLVRQQDVNIKHIAHTIQHDPALSSKILRTVNSSFYGQAHSISTISHALVVLGLNSVKTLALGFTLVANLKQADDDDGFNHMDFWKRCLYSASAARAFAKQMGMIQQEEAFLGGLLQDLGLLAMQQTLGAEYDAVMEQAGVDHRSLRSVERARYDTDHAEVGGALAEQWKLPPLLVYPVRFHESPDEAPEDVLPLVRCVALGGRVAEVFMSDSQGEALDMYYREAEAWFNLSREVAEPLLMSIHKNTIEMKRLFDLPAGDFGNPDEILSKANEALMTISMQQQRQTAELEARNLELVNQATRDSLTGVANRRRFNDYLAEHFAKTVPGGRPLSLLFMDVDHFKNFNDTYGHLLGDKVLVKVASVLSKAVKDAALVARYGGEEFAIVAPGFDRVQAARLAEGIRQLIARTTVVSDAGENLSITASIGVATHDGVVFGRPEQLVKAADQGVYAAKGAGRNAVRVFTARPRPRAVA